MPKYLNIDVIAFLEKEMKKNTTHYQSDFEYDKETFLKNATNEKREDRTFLWLSRPCGTHCLLERNVFLKNTSEHITWCFYGEQMSSDDYIAYAVELLEVEDGVVKGNVYSLDYKDHFKRVQRESLDSCLDKVIFLYERGEKLVDRCDLGAQPWDYVEELGEYKLLKGVPVDAIKFSYLMGDERARRHRLREKKLEVNK